MSLKARFFSENFYNDIMFSGHVISANTAAAGNEAFRVGTGRRMSARNKWTPTALNLAAWIKVVCDRVRTANCIVMDRGHNLAGETIRLEVSDDNFTTKTEVFNTVVPTLVFPNNHLDQLPGVKTEEGAWAFKFTPTSGRYWRLFIDAMGAGLKPEIVGLYLGLSYEPDYHLDLPFEDESGESFYNDVMSDTAWVASTRAASRRAGPIGLRLSSKDEYEKARYHIKKLFMEERRLMWIFFNQQEAERAVLARHNRGEYSFNVREGWHFRQSSFSWFEHEPALS